MKFPLAIVVTALFCSIPALAQEHPVEPYIDPTQLECPMPKHSFYKQPWRAYLETRSAEEFLNGIGINYNCPESVDDVAIPLLAECGIKVFRIEIGWDSVSFDETHLNNAERWGHLLRLCKEHGIRPTLLLNANHGAPCPVRFMDVELAEDAPKGSRSVKFVATREFVAGRTGLCNLTGEGVAAEAFITHIDADTGECQLSKPLPKAFKKGDKPRLATLKYLPLFPVGTPEFEETTTGWLHYAKLVTEQAKRAGIDEFDAEIWNELSFGSHFVEGFRYYDPSPYDPKKFPDSLHKGGSCWELSRRTAQQVKRDNPHARVIWGWSNTTFFHTDITQLPEGIDGQSYHPYGTGTRNYPKDEQYKNRPQDNLEGYTPTLKTRFPEGWAQEFFQTESLMRLLNPETRKKHPPGTERFFHYMTEHGVLPPECDVKDISAAWDLKTKCVLRSYCFWLNKGIDCLDYFCAYNDRPLDFELLPPELKKWTSPETNPARADNDFLTPPLRALRHLTQAFQGAEHLSRTRPLQVEATELGEPRQIFAGDGQHPPLWQRQAFAVLPFQVSESKFVIPVYAMTFDATKSFGEQSYRLTIGGLPSKVTVSLYDPIQDRPVAVRVVEQTTSSVTVELPATDYPRLLTLVVAQ
jgi:hypothetical protein